MYITQAKGQCGFINVSKLAAEEAFVILLWDTQPGLGNCVPERLGSGQPVALTGENRPDLGEEEIQGGVIPDQVVHGLQRSPAILLRIVGDEEGPRGAG